MKSILNLRMVASLGLVLVVIFGQAGVVQAEEKNSIPCITGYIQPRITSASDGGVVNIPAGTYCETLNVDASITLRGASMNTTILMPAADGQRVITVDSGKNLRLENLKVTGGKALVEPNYNVGGGVFVANGGLTLVSSVVNLNSALYGGGVFQAGATHKLIITDSLIDGNTAVYHGGGAYADGIVEYNNSTLSNNTAGWHGGGLFANIGNTQLTNGSITGNHTTLGDGGGVDANNDINVWGPVSTTTPQADWAGD